GEETFHYPKGESDEVPHRPAFSADGKQIAGFIGDRQTRLTRALTVLNLESGQAVQTIAAPEIALATDVCFSPDGGRIAARVGSEGEQIIIYSRDSGQKLQVLTLPTAPDRRSLEGSVAFDDNGNLLAVPQGLQIYLYNVDPKRPQQAEPTVR